MKLNLSGFPVVLILFFLLAPDLKNQQEKDEKLICQNGQVHFKSDAPLELIEARSGKLRGVIDTGSRRFAFTIHVNSFEGFNSPLQQEHFNEHYLNTTKFPSATFEGKIIEEINFSENGEKTIRAKGILNIHGVPQERIIKAALDIKDGKCIVFSRFPILLKEHNISIPKIVNQKIAEEIIVEVRADFLKKQ